MIRRQSIKFQISLIKDVRGVAGTRSDGWTDGRMHTQTGEGHFYSRPPPTSGDKNICCSSNPLLNHVIETVIMRVTASDL